MRLLKSPDLAFPTLSRFDLISYISVNLSIEVIISIFTVKNEQNSFAVLIFLYICNVFHKESINSKKRKNYFLFN